MNFREFKNKYEHEKVREFPNNVPENPIVSVCIQTFQHVSYIKQCIESILMQKTEFSFEILIGDDASTDGTREICLEYAKRYPHKIRLFLHHRANNIKINGLNTGRFNFRYNLFSTNGKYIALCDGDDYWTDPYKLQKQVDFLEKHSDYTLTVGGFISKSNNVPEVQNIKKIKKNDFEQGYSFTLEDTLKSWITKTMTALFLADKEAINSFADYNFGRDMNLFYHILMKGKGFYFTSILGVYNIHVGGVFSEKKNTVQNYIDHYLIYKELYEVNKDEYSRYMYLMQCIRLLNLKFSGIIKGHEFRFIPIFIKSCTLLKNYTEIMSLLKVFIPLKLKKSKKGKEKI